jgi:hypothetical protein
MTGLDASRPAIVPLPPYSSMTLSIIPLSLKGAKRKPTISITPPTRRDAARQLTNMTNQTRGSGLE